MAAKKKKAPRFTKKDDRMAGHVAESEMKRGVPAKEAKSIGYATAQKSGDASKAHTAKGTVDDLAAKKRGKKKRVRNIGRS